MLRRPLAGLAAAALGRVPSDGERWADVGVRRPRGWIWGLSRSALPSHRGRWCRGDSGIVYVGRAVRPLWAAPGLAGRGPLEQSKALRLSVDVAWPLSRAGLRACVAARRRYFLEAAFLM